MSSTLEYKFDFVLTELASLGLPVGSNPSIVHRPPVGKLVTDDTGSPPIEKVYSAELTLASNPTAIDLTALTDFKGDALTFSGLKVNFVYMRADPANNVSNFITIIPSQVNGYNLFGLGDWDDGAPQTTPGLIVLGPGDVFMKVLKESRVAVSGSLKSVDFNTATATNKIKILLAAGLT